MQSFLKAPKFDKQFFYKPPTDLYQEFCNAYAYSEQAAHCNIVPNKQKLLSDARTEWKKIREQNETIIHKKIQAYLATKPHIICSYQRIMRPPPTNSVQTSSISMLSSLRTSINKSITAKNARAQNDTIEKIKEATQQILETPDAALLLDQNNRFLPPLSKAEMVILLTQYMPFNILIS
ncbi:5574_t:CDS:2 [Racocetra fulgida]|uniref:5574_t:CDS:1 n=1 Tax=Racocetra fulgida TaxID=60492 RepID=A0A9N8ZZD3_9GLOM|nr:5574_t:CDS:2 [Racocetra fulgida]